MLYSVAFTIPFITMVVTDIAIYFKVDYHYDDHHHHDYDDHHHLLCDSIYNVNL